MDKERESARNLLKKEVMALYQNIDISWEDTFLDIMHLYIKGFNIVICVDMTAEINYIIDEDYTECSFLTWEYMDRYIVPIIEKTLVKKLLEPAENS